MISLRNPAVIVAAAIAATLHVSPALATFNYDLRFAPGQTGLLSPRLCVPVAGGTYTVQLWGQIFNQNNLNDGFNGATYDGWLDGFVGIKSQQLSSGTIEEGFTFGAITSGGVRSVGGLPVSARTPSFGSHMANFSDLGAHNPVDLNGDGLTDWGGTSTTSLDGWVAWITSGFPYYSLNRDQDYPNFVQSQSVADTTNGWEILIATFQIYTATLTGAGATGYNAFFPSGGIADGLHQEPAVEFYQNDPALAVGAAPITPFVTTATVGSGVVFQTGISVPEPASLAVLALGSLLLCSRRR